MQEGFTLKFKIDRRNNLLNGFDVSDCNGGIDVSQVQGDFAIVQHSCGNFIDPTFETQANATLNSGKELGVYHFITGVDGEIDTFINGIRPYVGKAIIALDWETGDQECPNTQWGNWQYLRRFAQAIQRELGVNPLLYASASNYGPLYSLGTQLNCGVWVAQYATDDPTGYQEAPWNENKYDMVVFQYSDNGRIDGYNGPLDLDLFYGDRDTWQAYAKSTINTPAPKKVEAPKTINYMINENALNANKDVIPVGTKVVITNIANDTRYLTSHNGGLEMSNTPMPWYIQRNNDNSISLADPWGNWITVSNDPKNGELPSVVKGNGSPEQRWMASNYNGGIMFTCLVNENMNLDLPEDNDREGQRVQVWWKWTTGEMCPNQTWKVSKYIEPAPKVEVKKSIDTKNDISHDAKTETVKAVPAPNKEIPTQKDEVKVNNDKNDDTQSRIIADLKDLSDISKTQESEVGDQIAGVVQAMFHTKKATKRMASWIFVIGSIFALTATILLVLTGCHILPVSGGVIAGVISGVFSGFAHAMGISVVKTK